MKSRFVGFVLALVVGAFAFVSHSILTPLTPVTGVNHIYYGAKWGDFLTEQLVAGDINGDTRDDIITGIYWDDPAPGGPPRAAASCGSGTTRLSNGVETVVACNDLNFSYWATIGYTTNLGPGPTPCDSCYWYPVQTEDQGAGFVFYGGNYDNVPLENDLNTVSPGLTIYGQNAGDKLLYVATGRINSADNLYDILLGAPQWQFYKAGLDFGPYYVQQGRGEAFVILGSATLPSTIDLRIPAHVSTYVHKYFSGRDIGDRLGYSSVVGNINPGLAGDEIIISAPWGDGANNLRNNSGEVYIFYPGASLPPSVDLSTLSDAAMAGYAQVIYGASPGDYLGIANVALIDQFSNYAPPSIAVGDWDQDTFDDLVIGAGNAFADDRGAVYIIFGGGFKLAPGNTIDLSLPPSTTNPNACDMVFYGVSAGDALGTGVELTDVDYDVSVKKDLLLGAALADNDDGGATIVNRGEAYIAFGATRATLLANSVAGVRDLSTAQFNSYVDVVVYGDDAGDQFGAYFAGNGNFDLDNFHDFVIGGRYAAPDDAAPGDDEWGQAAVFFGKSRAAWTADNRIHLKTALYNKAHRIFKIVSVPGGESNKVRLAKVDLGENADLVFGGYDAPGKAGPSVAPIAGQMYIMKGRDIWKSGTISTNQTWRDNVFITGDVTIAQGATVTLEPGTDVYIWPFDWGNSGIDASRVEFHVNGSLQAIGTQINPIRFVVWSDSLTALDRDAWRGIHIFDVPGASANFNYCTVANAVRAISTNVGITIKNSVIENCSYLGLSIAGDGATLDSVFVENTIIRSIKGAGAIGVNILNNKTSVRLNSCTIEDCATGVATYTNAKLYTLQTTVRNTTSEAGIRLSGGAVASLSSTTVDNCEPFGVKVYTGAVLNASSCTFKNSDGVSSRGMLLLPQGGNPPAATLTSCTFTGNKVGLRVENTSNVNATLCHFDNNIDQGVYCVSNANIVLSLSTMNNNVNGVRCNSSNPLITNDTIDGNNGGIVCEGTAYPTVQSTKVWNSNNGISFADNAGANMQPCGGACPPCGSGNSFKGSVGYHVSNLTQGAIFAACNYWGKTVPNPAKFYGEVYYMPYLSGDPLPTSNRPEDGSQPLPDKYALSENSPNPFNPTTTLRYDVPASGGTVRIRIYNVRGQLVRTLVNDVVSPGRHATMWDGTDERSIGVASGVYFVEMVATRFRTTRKIMLLK